MMYSSFSHYGAGWIRRWLLLDEEEWRRLGKINMPQLEVSSLGRVRLYDQFGVRDVVTFVEEGQLCVSYTLPNWVYCGKTLFFFIFYVFLRHLNPGFAIRLSHRQ